MKMKEEIVIYLSLLYFLKVISC